MSDEPKQVPKFLRDHLTQEQYDRAREYLKIPHVRVDLTPEEWDDLVNGRGWPKDCFLTVTKLDWIMGQQMLLAHSGTDEFRVWWDPQRNWTAEHRANGNVRGLGCISLAVALAWCEQGGRL